MHDSFHVVCVRVCVSAAKSHLDSICMLFYAGMYTVAQIKHRRTEMCAGRSLPTPTVGHAYMELRLTLISTIYSFFFLAAICKLSNCKRDSLWGGLLNKTKFMIASLLYNSYYNNF